MVTRVKIGTNVIAGNFPTHRLLERNNPLGRDVLPMQPHRDLGLLDGLPRQSRQPISKSLLRRGDLDTSPQGGDDLVFERSTGHNTGDYNTDSVIAVNTRSAIDRRQTGYMPKAARTTDFWKRLELARTTCDPPKSMKQKDIAKEYGYAYQSAVTKFKTGGPDGKSMPDPDVVVRMALDTNVNVNWLWAGQGDMRPIPATEPVVRKILDVVNELGDMDARLKVLETALLQKAALQNPTVAEQLRETQEAALTAAEKAAQPRRRNVRAAR